MALSTYKFTQGELAGSDVASLPDQPSAAGITAAELKARFDLIPKMLIALGKFNELIDALTASGGADVGASVPGMSGATVEALLGELKGLSDQLNAALGAHKGDGSNPHRVTKAQVGLGLADNTADLDKPISRAQAAVNTSVGEALSDRYTKAQADGLLALKTDKTTANLHLKEVAFDPKSGVFTFTRENGAAFTIDTLIEKIPLDVQLIGSKLVLTLSDGTTQEADLSAFIDTYTFQDSDTLAFSAAGKVISAIIKDGSVKVEKLDSAFQSTLLGYVERAETASEAASAAQGAAAASAATAASQASSASASAQAASRSETAAKASETAAAGSAQQSAQSAASARTKAEEAASSAVAAKGSEEKAKASETAAAASAGDAAASAASILGAEENAAQSAKDAAAQATLAKSYAVGGTDSRTGENADNARFYKEQAALSETAASASAASALASKSAASGSEGNASASAAAAKGSETAAATSAGEAQSSAAAAKASETAAKTAQTGAEASAATAATEAGKAKTSAESSAASAGTSGAKATLAESYAVGGTDSRVGEDTDNAKYYSEQAQGSAIASQASASSSLESENAASVSAGEAAASAQTAKGSETAAKAAQTGAEASAATAKASETAAKAAQAEAETAAAASAAEAEKAKTQADGASASAVAAKTSETNAAASAATGAGQAIVAESFSVGGTNTREGEDTDNAKYYKGQAALSETSAAASATAAAESKTAAAASAGEAAASASAAEASETAAQTAKTSAEVSAVTSGENAILAQSYAVGGTGSRAGENTDNAKYFKEQAARSETNAAGSASSALASKNAAGQSAVQAANSATDAAASAQGIGEAETRAAASATLSTDQATLSKSYAVGGTGTREGEDADNAKYYKEIAKAVAGGDFVTTPEMEAFAVKKTGDTMTGALHLVPQGNERSIILDSQVLEGGALTGGIEINATRETLPGAVLKLELLPSGLVSTTMIPGMEPMKSHLTIAETIGLRNEYAEFGMGKGIEFRENIGGVWNQIFWCDSDGEVTLSAPKSLLLYSETGTHIRDLVDPTEDTDAVPKKYVDEILKCEYIEKLEAEKPSICSLRNFVSLGPLVRATLEIDWTNNRMFAVGGEFCSKLWEIAQKYAVRENYTIGYLVSNVLIDQYDNNTKTTEYLPAIMELNIQENECLITFNYDDSYGEPKDKNFYFNFMGIIGPGQLD